MKIDKRKTYYLVLDVETCGDLDSPLVYDLGFAVCDRQGKIYERHSLVIKDIFYNENEKMNSAYYANKLPQYFKGIADGVWEVCSMAGARVLVQHTIRKYNIKMVLAYNANFDRNALNNTQRYINENIHYFLPNGTKVGCIWAMVCQTICCQKSYIRWCIDNNLISESGNLKTSAETVYAYLTQNLDFEESHTGLADVEIETYIFAQCMRQHKKMAKQINRLCWRIPTNKAKELALL